MDRYNFPYIYILAWIRWNENNYSNSWNKHKNYMCKRPLLYAGNVMACTLRTFEYDIVTKCNAINITVCGSSS